MDVFKPKKLELHKRPNQFGLIALVLFTVALLIMIAGTSLALWTSWTEKTRTTQFKLMQDATMVSSMLDASLLDALKLLESTKRDLYKTDPLLADEKEIQKILKASVEKFSFFKRDDVFGLLFYVDKNGQIVAQDSDGVLPQTNVLDRHYFEVLKSDPHRRFSIGHLVTARVSGNKVFHIAVPLLDQQGRFSGLILQQIKADDFKNIILMTQAQVGENLVSYLPKEPVTFAYPDTDTVLSISQEISHSDISADSRGGRLFGKGQSEVYLGYMTSRNFGLITVSLLPASVVFSEFLQEQKTLLVYALFASMSVLVMFVLLYRNYNMLCIAQASSVHDQLTGLFNRRGLDEQLPELMRQAARDNQSISVLFVDIDHFKRFNDTHGHEAGDQVLVNLSRLISGTLKRPMDLACRWGGEEFVVVLPSTDKKGAIYLAEKLMKSAREMSVGAPVLSDNNLTVSIGLTCLLVTPKNLDEDLVDQADKAMYMAKNLGRDRLVVFGDNPQNEKNSSSIR